jgi:hypothetical protein
MPLSEKGGAVAASTPTLDPGRKPPGSVATARPNVIERNIVDLTFAGAPLAARKVLNQIASSESQTYIIRTLHVRNEKDRGPPREQTVETTTPARPTQTNQIPAANTVLNFIVGHEHVEVSARIEMLRFTF